MGNVITLEPKTRMRNKPDIDEITIPMETFKEMQFKVLDLGNENALLKRRIRELENAR